MTDTAESVLRELVAHLAYDAGINGTKHTSHPVGRLNLATSEGALWKRVLNILGEEPDVIRSYVVPAILKRVALGE